MTEPARMWVGLHTEAPTPEFDPLGLRQLAGGEFARADVDAGDSASWASPTVTVPVAVEVADGVFYRSEIVTGGGTVTHMCVADAPTGGTVRMVHPTAETVVDDEGVTRQVWRETTEDEQ